MPEPVVTKGGSGGRRQPEDLTFLDLLNVILRRRGTVILCTFLGVLFALVMALRTPIEYTATVSFLPNSGDESPLQSMAGLAQQFGFTIPTSGAERSPEFYRDLIRSRRILDGLLASRYPLAEGGSSTVDLAEHFEIQAESPEEQTELARRYLVERVTAVELAGETGVVTVRVTTDQPGLSSSIAQRVIDLIAAFDLESRQSRASAERHFAQDRLAELQLELTIAEDSLRIFLDENRQFSNSPQLTFEHARLERRVAMRQELATAMAQLHDRSRIDEVRNTPVMTVVDHPEPPALPDRRGRVLKMLIGVTLGGLVGLGLALAGEYAARAKTGESVAYRELQDVLREVPRDLLGMKRRGAGGQGR
jgi:uncharacterized protein involved in exopolysaccharide biosynthesis